jgi:hypothetical protein
VTSSAPSSPLSPPWPLFPLLLLSTRPSLPLPFRPTLGTGTLEFHAHAHSNLALNAAVSPSAVRPGGSDRHGDSLGARGEPPLPSTSLSPCCPQPSPLPSPLPSLFPSLTLLPTTKNQTTAFSQQLQLQLQLHCLSGDQAPTHPCTAPGPHLIDTHTHTHTHCCWDWADFLCRPQELKLMLSKAPPPTDVMRVTVSSALRKSQGACP